MKRDAYAKLVEWKGSARRKPLVLQGARQVGKTYLLQAFAEGEYSSCAYFNFEEDRQLDDFFSGRLDPAAIIEKLGIYQGRKILPHETLIIFDEIQESENALNSLKYFSEQAGEFHVAAAGSLLGIKLDKRKSFPVGKVNFLHLYPLSFFEFLDAVGKSALRGVLEALDAWEPLAQPFHQELMDLLRLYYFIGGMPEAIASYVQDRDLNVVREIHKELLLAYTLDFSKHAAPSDAIKITAIWESIPSQLAKENKKFIFSAIRKSARSREYASALQWLQDAGLIYKASHLSTPKLPLSAYSNQQIFKVFLVDCGLLGAMVGTPARHVVEQNRLLTEFAGAFTENYVAQELTAVLQAPLYYWTSQGTAEVDFVVASEDKIYPLEVKAGASRRKKSLRVYQQKYQAPLIARTSAMNLKKDDDVCNIPLYAIARFLELVS